MKPYPAIIFAAAAVLVVAFAPALWAQGTGSGTSSANLCALDPEWGGTSGGVSWTGLAFTGILTIMTFLSLVYMAAVLLSRVEWIIWAKDEFYQAIISAMLIILISWFATLSCTMSFSLAGGNPFAVADVYLNNLIWEKSLKVATGVFLTGIYASAAAAFFVAIGGPPSGFRPFAGLDAIANLMNFLFLIVSTLFSSMMLQLIILKLVQAMAFKVILPIGIVFRVFPFLRKAGALFIAVAFGMYIVYPMMYVFDKAVMDSINLPTGIYEDTPAWEADTFGGAYARFISYEAIIKMVTPISHVQEVANLIPQALFLPTLNLIVAYAFMKSFVKVLSQNFPSPFS
jgi:hypothetical protein